MAPTLLDAAGHRRSPATLPGYHVGRPPRNKGMRYPADPPTIEEIVAVMRATDDRPDGLRLRALIVILWRAGLRIGEALALAETDLDPRRGAVIVRRGKGGKRRETGMDRWAWEQLEPWLTTRAGDRPPRRPCSHRRTRLSARLAVELRPEESRRPPENLVRSPKLTNFLLEVLDLL
jgi:integrase